MNILSYILLGISLSFDSLAASITIGISKEEIKKKQILKVSGYMAFFQAIMPFAGWYIGSQFTHIAKEYDHYIALILLILIGTKMIHDGIKNKYEHTTKLTVLSSLFLIGISLATSIDALIVGVTFGVLAENIYLASVIIGIITFIFSMSGLYFGKKIGSKINGKVEVIGGIILIAIGIKIFILDTSL
ncbi:MAG: manganese efflux pump MntP family protein [Bacteroidales bacterium]